MKHYFHNFLLFIKQEDKDKEDKDWKYPYSWHLEAKRGYMYCKMFIILPPLNVEVLMRVILLPFNKEFAIAGIWVVVDQLHRCGTLASVCQMGIILHDLGVHYRINHTIHTSINHSFVVSDVLIIYLLKSTTDSGVAF